jgi:carbon starvation protein CstA
MGGVTVAAIVVLAITSGDTALRSARLSLGEEAGIDQVKVPTRVLTCLPLVAIVAALLWWSNKDKGSFGHLWNYFAWMNQLVSTTMLMAATVWLLRLGRGAKSLVTFVPGIFMCMVITTFIFWAWPSKGQVWGVIPGGLSLTAAACAGAVVTAAVVAAVLRSGLRGGGRAGADAAAK